MFASGANGLRTREENRIFFFEEDQTPPTPPRGGLLGWIHFEEGSAPCPHGAHDGRSVVIYFIQDSATYAIKIGHTNDDPYVRLDALQTGNPSELVLLTSMPGECFHEARLHRNLAAARIRGEWFRPVPELLLLLCEVCRREALRAERRAVWEREQESLPAYTGTIKDCRP